MHVIAIANHKGGVGKTTTALNLSKALALLGKKVLMIDIDPQANLSQSVGVENHEPNLFHAFFHQEPLKPVQVAENLALIPTELELSTLEMQLMTDVNGYFRLKKLLKPFQETYEYVLIDCPPSLGILTINAMISAHSTIICVQSQYLAMKGLNNILDFVESLQENHNPHLRVLGLLLTQVNNTVLSRNIVQAIHDNFSQKVFNTTIRQNIALAESSTQAVDIFTYDPNCNGAKDYMDLAKEMINS